MKHVLTLLAVAALMLSCSKKDWNCKCEISGTFSNNGTHNKTITGKTKGAANTECSDYGKALINGNGVYKCQITEL